LLKVNQKVIAYKFKSTEYNTWVGCMEKYDGEEGIIVSVFEHAFGVRFPDGEIWEFPESALKLVPEEEETMTKSNATYHFEEDPDSNLWRAVAEEVRPRSKNTTITKTDPFETPQEALLALMTDFHIDKETIRDLLEENAHKRLYSFLENKPGDEWDHDKFLYGSIPGEEELQLLELNDIVLLRRRGISEIKFPCLGMTITFSPLVDPD